MISTERFHESGGRPRERTLLSLVDGDPEDCILLYPPSAPSDEDVLTGRWR